MGKSCEILKVVAEEAALKCLNMLTWLKWLNAENVKDATNG